MQKTKYNIGFSSLPLDILSTVFLYLSVRDLLSLSVANSMLWKIIRNNNFFWLYKLRLHFPYLLSSVSSNVNQTTDRYADFFLANDQEYKKKFKPLFFTIKEGDLTLLKTWLAKGKFSINHLIKKKDKQGLTPMDWMVSMGYQHFLDFIFSLVREDFNNKAINKKVFSITLSAKMTNRNILEIHDDKLWYLVHWAVLCNQPQELISSYLENEVYMKGPLSPLHIAAQFGINDLIEFLSEFFEINGHAQYKQQFLAGLKTFQTPLHLAAAKGHVKTVELLLNLGADPQACMAEFSADDHTAFNQSIIPLHCAAAANRVEVVKLLLAKGCSPLAEDCYSMSALRHAVKKDYRPLFNILIESIPKFENNNQSLDITLFEAILEQRTHFIQPLLDKGANPGWKNTSNYYRYDGRTAHDVAVEISMEQGNQAPLLTLLANRSDSHALPLQAMKTTQVGMFVGVLCCMVFLLPITIALFVLINFLKIEGIGGYAIALAAWIAWGLLSGCMGGIIGKTYSSYKGRQAQAVVNRLQDSRARSEFSPLLLSNETETGITKNFNSQNQEGYVPHYQKFTFLGQTHQSLGKEAEEIKFMDEEITAKVV